MRLGHAAATSAIAVRDESDAAPALAEISSPGRAPANENWPIVELVPVGDGAALARALVRVLVRRALISEGVFSVGEGCSDQKHAG